VFDDSEGYGSDRIKVASLVTIENESLYTHVQESELDNTTLSFSLVEHYSSIAFCI
jgi:hypothetical protein